MAVMYSYRLPEAPKKPYTVSLYVIYVNVASLQQRLIVLETDILHHITPGLFTDGTNMWIDISTDLEMIDSGGKTRHAEHDYRHQLSLTVFQTSSVRQERNDPNINLQGRLFV